MSPRGGYNGHRIAFGHGHVTELQQRTWDLVAQTGSQTEAARILGRTQGAVQSAMQGYQFAMGITGPLPGARVYRNGVKRGTGPWAQARARIAELEADVARLESELDAAVDVHRADLLRLMERIADLTEQAHPWASIGAKLDTLLARPAGVVFQPDHRRVRDGGTPVRQQRKALRPTG